MYYALINDTNIGTAKYIITPERLVDSLTSTWSGPDSSFNIAPEKIILGYSLASEKSSTSGLSFIDPSMYFSKDILSLAKGGVTRWAEKGGGLNWGSYAHFGPNGNIIPPPAVANNTICCGKNQNSDDYRNKCVNNCYGAGGARI